MVCVIRYKRTSLKILGTVGEPINPEAWQWYYSVVGEKRCPVVDTFWQTETVSTELPEQWHPCCFEAVYRKVTCLFCVFLRVGMWWPLCRPLRPWSLALPWVNIVLWINNKNVAMNKKIHVQRFKGLGPVRCPLCSHVAFIWSKIWSFVKYSIIAV